MGLNRWNVQGGQVYLINLQQCPTLSPWVLLSTHLHNSPHIPDIDQTMSEVEMLLIPFSTAVTSILLLTHTSRVSPKLF